jgi:hypothetical protein
MKHLNIKDLSLMKSIFVSCLAVAVLVGVSGCEKSLPVLADWQVHEESKRCELYKLNTVVVESWKGVHDVFCEPEAKSIITIN